MFHSQGMWLLCMVLSAVQLQVQTRLATESVIVGLDSSGAIRARVNSTENIERQLPV